VNEKAPQLNQTKVVRLKINEKARQLNPTKVGRPKIVGGKWQRKNLIQIREQTFLERIQEQKKCSKESSREQNSSRETLGKNQIENSHRTLTKNQVENSQTSSRETLGNKSGRELLRDCNKQRIKSRTDLFSRDSRKKTSSQATLRKKPGGDCGKESSREQTFLARL